MEKGLTKNEIISTLTKAVHAGGVTKRKKGEKLPKLTFTQKVHARTKALFDGYGVIGLPAVKADEHFFTRLVAWNHQKGQVRDAKVALPVIGLLAKDPELLESNLAHLADLRPREFVRAIEFAKAIGVGGNTLRRLVARWLMDLETNANEFEKTALLHKDKLKFLYGRFHIKPGWFADAVLFKGDYTHAPRFAAVADLKNQLPAMIETQLRNMKLPWMLTKAALGNKIKEPGVLAAVIKTMSPTELTTNMAQLQKLGVKDHAITRAALEDALGAAATKKGAAKAVLLKATVAAEALEAAGDTVAAGKLRALQEKQLDIVNGIDGNWLVLADKSPSMQEGVAKGVEVASVLARLVRGKVYLVFFNEVPEAYDVTGKTLEEIKNLTRFVRAGGQGTRAYVGLEWLMENKIAVDGIAVVGDGGENVSGEFAKEFNRYEQVMGNRPSIYFYRLKPGPNYSNQADTFSPQLKEIQVFDLRGGVDYTTLPNIVQTMRVGKFSLLDEVMATPLRTLDEVLDRTLSFEVVKREAVGA